MAIFTIKQRLSPNELALPTACARMVGQDVPVHIDGAPEGLTVTGTIRRARVVDDGTAYEIELEIPEPPTVLIRGDLRGLSLPPA